MSEREFPAGEVRVGAAYEAERAASRAALAASSPARRVDLGSGLVLVVETPESIRAALEETLRARRTVDAGQVAAEAAAFAELRPAPDEVVATLYLDVADPAALADRAAELEGIADALALELGDLRVPGRADPAGASAGAARIVFPLPAPARERLRRGQEVAMTVDHPRIRARAVLSEDQLAVLVQS